MTDAKTIINLGLGKLGASRITSIAPPRTPLETHCSVGYSHWRDDELIKHPWRFALDYQRALSVHDQTPNGMYRFVKPNDCLRVLRDRTSEWQEYGNYLVSSSSSLSVDLIVQKSEADFTAAFINVLACRVAKECVEHATQSNTKGETAEMKYDKAVAEAKRINAFTVGSEDNELLDEHSSWLMNRYNPGLYD